MTKVFLGIKRGLSVIALAALVGLTACGVDKDGGGGGRIDAETITAGVGECLTCHADGSIDKFEDEAVFSTWLYGPHGNYETVDESHQSVDLGADNLGYPYFGQYGMGEEGSTCTTICHDQLGAGMMIEEFCKRSGLDALGCVNRPVIACESCHGSGAEHSGMGQVQYPRPDASRCGACHNSEFPENHYAYHPEGGNIYEDYEGSRHGMSKKVLSSAVCSRCHTDEGAKAYAVLYTAGMDNEGLEAAMSGAQDIESPTRVQCRTCHDNHNPDRLLIAASTDALGNAISSEYGTCTSCHQLRDTDGLRHMGYHGAWGSGAMIADTHMDDPATENIEGYVIDPSNERACRDCHNVHSADLTINAQWAGSAHAGLISDLVNAATGVAEVTEDTGAPFVHYDFKANTGGSDDTGRQACQKCHTSTGLVNYLEAPTDYDADADRLPDVLNEFYATGEEREMIYCWACHSSSAGTLRDPGAIVADYTDAQHEYPDVEGSNICISCHRGRESGESIKASDDDFTDKGFINAHYLSAGGTVFGVTGYEYNGVSYDGQSFFIHDEIGTAAVPGTGENGPCVGCHMNHDEGHTFLPLIRNSSGAIEGITAYENTCSSCHTDGDGLVADMGRLEAGFEAALDALEARLDAKGFAFSESYPYFSASDWTTLEDPTGKDNMGAAFNFNLLLHDPGAYVHNSLYTRRLIYDSIDFLDDGDLNSSVEVTLGGSGDAYDYLSGTRP